MKKMTVISVVAGYLGAVGKEFKRVRTIFSWAISEKEVTRDSMDTAKSFGDLDITIGDLAYQKWVAVTIN